MVAHFPLGADDTSALIANELDPNSTGKVLFGAQLDEKDGPELEHVSYDGGQAFKLTGDDPLYFPSVIFFRRSLPFSVGIKTWIPERVNEGVLFHFNKAGILYNYKGFEVSLLNGHWEIRMAHTFPYNSIQLLSENPAEKDVWQHVLLTYDGSSSAAGFRLYVDGKPVAMRVERDRLYKNMVSSNPGPLQKEIALKVGARWRSRGLPGALVDDVRVFDRRLTGREVSYLAGSKVADNDYGQEYDFYLNRYNEPYRGALKALAELRTERNSLNETVGEVMVMEELPEPRQAYVLKRGAYDAHGKPVSPGTPKAILPYSDNLPANRLGLAQWLLDPDHPLTARVTVNRYWQIVFTHGIVGTPEDFGNQGQLPTHPELLDWLARQFIDSGWNVKEMMRLMVTSATYRQSSKAELELINRDPENLLLARGPVVRLSAEMLRDNALAASGLLVSKVGGPSVYPYQPADLWSLGKTEYKQGTGEDLYRRSLYTVWKRTVPPPTMNNFDAPSRSYCIVNRQQTDTPLQALTLMNDPQFVEASRVLAGRVMRMAMAGSEEDRLVMAYRLLTSRIPNENELDLLGGLHDQLLRSFSGKPEKVDKLLSVGEKPFDTTLEKERLAALTLVISMIMNHDAAVVKR